MFKIFKNETFIFWFAVLLIVLTIFTKIFFIANPNPVYSDLQSIEYWLGKMIGFLTDPVSLIGALGFKLITRDNGYYLILNWIIFAIILGGVSISNTPDDFFFAFSVFYFLGFVFSYLMISIPYHLVTNRKSDKQFKLLKNNIRQRYLDELIMPYFSKMEILPSIAFKDFTLLGFIHSQVKDIADTEAHKSKIDIHTKTYAKLQNLFNEELKSAYPNIPFEVNPENEFQFKNKDGFKKSMRLSKEEFAIDLEKILANYSKHPDDIDRSNVPFDSEYNISKGFEKINKQYQEISKVTKNTADKLKNKTKETLDDLKGTSKLRRNIQDIKELLNDKTITDEEFKKLRKATLEKYMESFKGTNVIKIKIKELEGLREDGTISEEEFTELRKLALSKYM